MTKINIGNNPLDCTNWVKRLQDVIAQGLVTLASTAITKCSNPAPLARKRIEDAAVPDDPIVGLYFVCGVS